MRKTFIAVCSAWLCASCWGDVIGPSDAPVSGEPTFVRVREDILRSGCALGSCHGGATPAAQLDLAGESLADGALCRQLVAHESCLFPGRRLVAAGQPQDSF